MNLTTTYMGMKLANPLVPSASPLSAEIDTIRRMEDAGAAAVVAGLVVATRPGCERFGQRERAPGRQRLIAQHHVTDAMLAPVRPDGSDS